MIFKKQNVSKILGRKGPLLGRYLVWEFRSSLGVAIGRAALAKPRTGTNEPLGRGPVSGGLGRIAFTVAMS